MSVYNCLIGLYTFGLVRCAHVPENPVDNSFRILCKMCTLDEAEQYRLPDDNYLNARHPDVLLKTIKIYKYRQNTTNFIILYHFWTTCFDSLESSSGPLVNCSLEDLMMTPRSRNM